ncbi:MAG: hypothetical protein ACREAF_02955, partial [Nitrosopumilaceae archaeon]
LIPFNADSIKNALDETITIQRELLEGFATLPNSDRELLLIFLKALDNLQTLKSLSNGAIGKMGIGAPQNF